MKKKSKSKPNDATPPPAAQKLLASIDVFEEDVVISRYLERGGVERRLASCGDVAAMMSAAAASEVAWWPSGQHVLAVGLDADGGQRWLVLRPAGRTSIRLQVSGKTRRATFWCPALVAEITGRMGAGGRIQWNRVARVYACDGSGLASASPLHAAPFANVHGGRASMCNVDMKKTAGQSPLEAFENAFLGSAFTSVGLDGCLSPDGQRKFRNAWDLYVRAPRRGGLPRVDLAWLKKEGTYGSLFTKR